MYTTVCAHVGGLGIIQENVCVLLLVCTELCVQSCGRVVSELMQEIAHQVYTRVYPPGMTL